MAWVHDFPDFFKMSFLGYEPVLYDMQKKLIEEYSKAAKEELV